MISRPANGNTKNAPCILQNKATINTKEQTPNTTHCVCTVLKERFGDRVISTLFELVTVLIKTLDLEKMDEKLRGYPS